jgi:hypothetical protein
MEYEIDLTAGDPQTVQSVIRPQPHPTFGAGRTLLDPNEARFNLNESGSDVDVL